MTVFINISLAVCNSAYVCYLAILYSKGELGNCSIAVGSGSFFKTVLTVLKTCKLCIVSGECCLCYLTESLAAVDLDACKGLAGFFNCKYECRLACRLRDRCCAESKLIYNNASLCILDNKMSILVNISLAVCNSAYILYLAVLNCECELGYCCIALGSGSFFKTVLAVLQALEFCIVTLELSLGDCA